MAGKKQETLERSSSTVSGAGEKQKSREPKGPWPGGMGGSCPVQCPGRTGDGHGCVNNLAGRVRTCAAKPLAWLCTVRAAPPRGCAYQPRVKTPPPPLLRLAAQLLQPNVTRASFIRLARADVPITQQRLPACKPILEPVWVFVSMLVFGKQRQRRTRHASFI